MGRHEISEPAELDAACPTCQANPGKECTWGVTTVRRFHKARKAPVAVPSSRQGTTPAMTVDHPADAAPTPPVLYARHDARRLGL